MKQDLVVQGLSKLGAFLNQFLQKKEEDYIHDDMQFSALMRRSELENPWFTQENMRFCLENWTKMLTEERIKNWLSQYQTSQYSKKVGLILAGNIPLVGFHDVICVLLSNHIPLIKPSSKDQLLLPFLLKKWNEFSEGKLVYHFVERLDNYDAVIATGSNNTAKYLEYYFRNTLSIIRKNRTSVAVLKGNETNEQLQLLAEDIFRYFGLGCRNVTKLLLPKEMELNRLFENFIHFKDIINHNKYANNYDYNRAVYLLNQELFWDNNFVMMKEDQKLFSPLSVINFSRYKDLEEAKSFLLQNEKEIQCVIAQPELGLDSLNFGEAQKPSLDTYADNVDTMEFLSVI
ncbi:MAG: acyl-CoA reductase [Cloacibacterium sp.]|nr:acyl-CoA reductase [Cloacibacterium sp.]